MKYEVKGMKHDCFTVDDVIVLTYLSTINVVNLN